MSRRVSVKTWLTAKRKNPAPLDAFAAAVDGVEWMVNILDVSLVETLEHLETLLAAMQIAAGKKVEYEPTAEEVASAIGYLQFLDTEGAFNGLSEAIQEAIEVAEEWQSQCEASKSDAA